MNWSTLLKKSNVSKSRLKGWVGFCPLIFFHSSSAHWAPPLGRPGLAVAVLVAASWASNPVEDILDLVSMEKTWWYRSMRQKLLIQSGEVSKELCQGWFILGLCREAKFHLQLSDSLYTAAALCLSAFVDLVWLCHVRTLIHIIWPWESSLNAQTSVFHIINVCAHFILLLWLLRYCKWTHVLVTSI